MSKLLFVVQALEVSPHCPLLLMVPQPPESDFGWLLEEREIVEVCAANNKLLSRLIRSSPKVVSGRRMQFVVCGSMHK